MYLHNCVLILNKAQGLVSRSFISRHLESYGVRHLF